MHRALRVHRNQMERVKIPMGVWCQKPKLHLFK